MFIRHISYKRRSPDLTKGIKELSKTEGAPKFIELTVKTVEDADVSLGILVILSRRRPVIAR